MLTPLDSEIYCRSFTSTWEIKMDLFFYLDAAMPNQWAIET